MLHVATTGIAFWGDFMWADKGLLHTHTIVATFVFSKCCNALFMFFLTQVDCSSGSLINVLLRWLYVLFWCPFCFMNTEAYVVVALLQQKWYFYVLELWSSISHLTCDYSILWMIGLLVVTPYLAITKLGNSPLCKA
jgi:hypothetical protein